MSKRQLRGPLCEMEFAPRRRRKARFTWLGLFIFVIFTALLAAIGTSMVAAL